MAPKYVAAGLTCRVILTALWLARLNALRTEARAAKYTAKPVKDLSIQCSDMPDLIREEDDGDDDVTDLSNEEFIYVY